MFRTLFLWTRERQRRKNVFQKRKTSTSRKRSLRLESLENRQLLSVNPITNFESIPSDLYPMTLEESIASSSIANTASATQAEMAYAALVAENGENNTTIGSMNTLRSGAEVATTVWFNCWSWMNISAFEGNTGTSAGNVQIYRHAPLESNELESALTITLSIQSSSSATYGTNGDYTLRWSGNASSPNSSVAITEVNSNGEFTVTFDANSGLGILWIDAIDDELVEETETVNFTIVSQPNYNVKAFQETAIIRIQDVSPTAAFTNLSTVTSNFLEGTSGDYGIWVNGLNPNHGVTLDVQVGGSSSSQLGLASANGDYYFEWIVGETTETITTVDDDGQIHLALPAGVSSGILRVKANLDDYYEPTETTPITLNILTSSTYRAVPLAQKSFCIEDRVWATFQIVSNSTPAEGYPWGAASWAIAIPNWSLFDPTNAHPEYSSYEQDINGVTTTVTCTNATECNTYNRILYVNNGTYYGRWRYEYQGGGSGKLRMFTDNTSTESHLVKIYSRTTVFSVLEYTYSLETIGSYIEGSKLDVFKALQAANHANLSLRPADVPDTGVSTSALDSWIQEHEESCTECHVS